MVEGKALTLFLAAQHFQRQLFILLHKHRKIILGQRIRIARRTYHRLHAKFPEAEVSHMEYIVSKIGVFMGIRAAHIVAPAAAFFHKSLKIGHYSVIAAVSGIVPPEVVVHFFSAVKAKHHVVHFPVQKIGHVVVKQDTVCSKGKAEILALFLFNASCICHQLLYDLKVHKRLAAEKIDLKVFSRPGIGYEEIKCLFTHLKGHQSPVAVIFSLTCKAV